MKRENLKKYLFIFSIWVFIGVLYSTQSYLYRAQIGQDVQWLNILLVDSLYFIFWSVFMPVAFFLSKKWPFSKTNWMSPGMVHLTSALIISFIHNFIYYSFRDWIDSGTLTFPKIFLTIFAFFDYSLLVYFVMLFIIQVLIYNKKLKTEHEKSIQLKSALTQSQLDVLKSQLQPHFLFNTLNSISVLTKENPQLANKTIHLLSDLLRYSLKHAQTQFVTVEAEVNFIKDYLAIEKIRFAERLEVEIKIDPEILHLNVPSLLLQPIIENAVKHGVTEKRGKGHIKLYAQKRDNWMVFEITDNGDSGETLSLNEDDLGIGLKNTIHRLESLYGEQDLFKLTGSAGEGTMAVIKIPIDHSSETGGL